jgi:phosphinothricin acetyltransferase
MQVRRAEERDCERIAEILRDEILGNFAHFATEPQSAEDVRNDFARFAHTHPWLVAVCDEEPVAGFARAGPWKSRGAYRWTVEVGVYVCGRLRRRGVGRALYAALFPAIEAAGYRTVLAGIALPNEPSVRLHEAFGMRHVGTLPKAGFKLGEWRDVGYWARHFGDGPPAALAEPQRR